MPHPLRLTLKTTEGSHELHLETREDEALSDLLARQGFPMNTRCGGRGLCAGCEARLEAGALRNRADGSMVDTPGTIRTCLHTTASRELTLTLPERSMLKHMPEVVSDFRIEIPRGLDPIRKGVRYGAAVDIGTTTVALILVDLSTGEIAAEASAFNAQVRFGEDVLTRIQACSQDHSQVGAMQRAVAGETIQRLLETACRGAGIALGDVGVMTVAGNTTMLHLFAGVDPSPLGVHPFSPVFIDHRELAPGEVGLEFGDGSAPVHLLPGAAAYVGADITAGIVATGMLYEDKPVLLVDVGTNGEIVARAGERLLGCATAAGPAFEGAGLFSGVRAVQGAIERLRIQRHPFAIVPSVIGKVSRPIGICGSAYVDFLAEARSAGFLESSGRFSETLLAQPEAGIETGTYGKRLVVTENGASGKIQISELDIARLLQAKAAIAAGIQTLLGLLGCAPGDIDRVYLAGGFGMHLSLEHAIGCGLLPGFHPQQIRVVGNTSLGGAMLALTQRDLLNEMMQASRMLEEIELNLQPGFEDAYIDNLELPTPETFLKHQRTPARGTEAGH